MEHGVDFENRREFQPIGDRVDFGDGLVGADEPGSELLGVVKTTWTAKPVGKAEGSPG